ncbi:hypothetical protein CFC21_043716 [Triticum aestivum]|uniref:F-box domain-containing protein n=2 Tax=Triticum aestivum TaxID=4565 RepID=A0A9R1JWY2_WHEAT|nr:hypothetical protein CFC21_043716 [Triticum aestivum]
MCPRRRRTSPPPASLPDDDDLLREILLRLPSRPSSLPRASLVCKHWRCLVADPQFQRCFRDHHGKPPLLGFFVNDVYHPSPFVPMLDRPDRIPGARFSMPLHKGNRIIDCRHGLVLLLSSRQKTGPPIRLFVWDPVAREQRRVILPPELDRYHMFIFNGAVLRSARGHGHFQVALVAHYVLAGNPTRVFACLYSSENGIWSNINSLQLQKFEATPEESSTLSGNSICWLNHVVGHDNSRRYVILELDLDRQSLAVTELPPQIEADYAYKLRIMPAEDGGLGFIVLSGLQLHAQLWKRKPDSDGLAVWVLDRTIEFKGLPSNREGYYLCLVGFAEESNAILLKLGLCFFMVYLQSMELKKLSKMNFLGRHYPFEYCYAAGNSKPLYNFVRSIIKL